MGKVLNTIFVSFAFTITVFAQRPLPEKPNIPPDFQLGLENGTRTLSGVPGASYWTNFSFYRLEAEVNPLTKMVKGSGEVRYINRSPEPLFEVYFDISQNLHGADALARKSPVELTGGMNLRILQPNGVPFPAENLKRTGNIVRLLLDNPVPSRGSAFFNFEWEFKIPRDGAGGRMGWNEDNLIYLAYWYPQITVFDDLNGWHNDPFTGLAEFYMPFADYEVTLTVPQQWIVTGTGTLQNARDVLNPEVFARYQIAQNSQTVVQIVGTNDLGNATRNGSDGKLTWHFSSKNVRDAAFSIMKNSVWDAMKITLDNKPEPTFAQAFYRPQKAPKWKNAARYVQQSIKALSNHTGVIYPYPHMTAVEGNGIMSGGMEYPMMTLIDHYTNRSEEDFYSVLNHELAHQWMPMLVNTNERRYGWMDEGFTSFNDNVTRKAFFIESDVYAGDIENYHSLAQTQKEGEMMRLSDYHYSDAAYVAASYGKPASVLRALNGIMGETLFKQTFQKFFKDWLYKHPHPTDFFNAFQQGYGQDLSWFWDTWYYKTWTLDQAITGVTVANDVATVYIKDLGKAPMPIFLKLTLADGSTHIHSIPVSVWFDGAIATRITMPVNSIVVKAEIDPEHYFPDINRENNVWKN